MKKGFLGVMLTAAMVSGVFAGVASAEEKTQIRVYIGGDNADLNQKLVNDFNAQSEDVEAEIVTLTEGQSGYQMLTVMYNSNSAPNVFFLESGDILALQDKLADVSDLECMQYAAEGTLDDVTVDGRILGAPVKMQAYGMIYSKAVAANALGEDFDPNVHNAVMTEETEEYESGKVSGVMQKGYTLNGKVIRPSMVKVVS